MPPAGYPAFLQYLQSGRVSRARHWRCLSEDIDQESFAHKRTELRDRLASIKLQLDPVDRSHDETAELAARVFELL